MPLLLLLLVGVQAVFGWGAVVWTNAFPILIGWHFIFLVNSACHLWGRQPYDAGGHGMARQLTACLPRPQQQWLLLAWRQWFWVW